MIHDTLDQHGRYESIVPAFKQAFQFLKTKAHPSLAEGQIELDGERLFAKIAKYTTRDFEIAQPEAHRRYIDIQYLVSGREIIYWTPLAETAPPVVEYDAEKDLIFYGHNSRARPFELHTGDFAIFFPSDAHQPNCHLGAAGPVHKVVIKVQVP